MWTLPGVCTHCVCAPSGCCRWWCVGPRVHTACVIPPVYTLRVIPVRVVYTLRVCPRWVPRVPAGVPSPGGVPVGVPLPYRGPSLGVSLWVVPPGVCTHELDL